MVLLHRLRLDLRMVLFVFLLFRMHGKLFLIFRKRWFVFSMGCASARSHVLAKEDLTPEQGRSDNDSLVTVNLQDRTRSLGMWEGGV